MPSLLDLTIQGDAATIADESQLPQIKLMEPIELYRLWERQNWVSHQFSGLVMAAQDKHEEAFLLTQQVDEARHAQHFNRLFEEVFGFDGSFEDRLQMARPDLNDDYLTLFDGHLVDAHQARVP